MKIKQKENYKNIYEWDHEVSYPWWDKKEYVLWTLNNRELPNNQYVKVGKRNLKFTAWSTTFKVEYFWWKSGLYRVTNLSDNKMYYIEKWEEKIVWREWEIKIDAADVQASKEHLKLKVDEENNLFLCNISKYWTTLEKDKKKEAREEDIKFSKMTDKEIEDFSKISRTKEANFFYSDRKAFQPKYKIDLWNWTTLYTTDRLNWIIRDEIIAYTKTWDKMDLRMFYRSGSEGIWRSCPWIREKEWKPSWFSKWEGIENYCYETTTKVVTKIWSIFDSLDMTYDIHGDPVDESYKLWFNILMDKMKEETKVDSLFTSSEIRNLVIDEVKKSMVEDKNTKNQEYYKKIIENCKKRMELWIISHSISWSIITGYYDDEISIPWDEKSVKRMYEKAVPSSLDYKNMEFKKSIAYENTYLWIVETDIYQTTWNWKLVDIYFSRAKKEPDKVRIDEIKYADAKINSFWIINESINAIPLVWKPIDYRKQTPYNRENNPEKGYGDYADMREIYQNNPIIKYYKSLKWI